uniref:Uncharacterized protein n=1 Tax=Glossina pallidipes TaxID=7398 RepID=A0A1A9ZN58_GLOPL
MVATITTIILTMTVAVAITMTEVDTKRQTNRQIIKKANTPQYNTNDDNNELRQQQQQQQQQKLHESKAFKSLKSKFSLARTYVRRSAVFMDFYKPKAANDFFDHNKILQVFMAFMGYNKSCANRLVLHMKFLRMTCENFIKRHTYFCIMNF